MKHGSAPIRERVLGPVSAHHITCRPYRKSHRSSESQSNWRRGDVDSHVAPSYAEYAHISTLSSCGLPRPPCLKLSVSRSILNRCNPDPYDIRGWIPAHLTQGNGQKACSQLRTEIFHDQGQNKIYFDRGHPPINFHVV